MELPFVGLIVAIVVAYFAFSKLARLKKCKWDCSSQILLEHP